MAQLNVNEAQRKAMLEWMGEVDPDDFDYEEWLDGLFAAANSIPEGAPVGTIARRPDGAFVAVRALASDLGEYWTYTCVDHTAYEDDLVPWPGQYDADSWPVIYDPREPDGPDLLAHKFSDAGIPIPSWANSVEVKVEAPNSTAQQELEAFNRFPGIENVTAADRIGADNADAQLGLVFKLRDIRIGRGLEISDVAAAMEVSAAEVARFESGSTNPRMSMIRRYARAVEAVFTVDVRKWEDSSAQQEPGESLARGLDDIAAGRVSRRDDYLEPQPEPKLCSGCCQCQAPKPPRTPRVVDRLGVDERGAEWKRRGISRVSYIWEYRFRNGVWQVRLVGNEAWASMSPGTEPTNGPYTEVLGDPS